MRTKIEPIAEAMNVGVAIMGNDRRTSALNRDLQATCQHNVFVMRASAFPQNIQYNSTGTVLREQSGVGLLGGRRDTKGLSAESSAVGLRSAR